MWSSCDRVPPVKMKFPPITLDQVFKEFKPKDKDSKYNETYCTSIKKNSKSWPYHQLNAEISIIKERKLNYSQ